MDDIFGELKNKAIYLLSRREHGEKELLGKLLKGKHAGVEHYDIAVKVIEELVERDYLSDVRFAEMSVRSRAMQGCGPLRIRQELMQKQVPDSIAELAIEEAEFDWFANAVALRDKKYGLAVIDDFKLKAKQQRFLQYKGYNFDHIHHAMEARDES